jgi:hypothetical protein
MSLAMRVRRMVRLRLASVLLAALLALPLSGCLEDSPGPGGLVMASGLFAFAAIDRDDPGAVAVEDCATLQDALKQRALDQARVALDQGVREEYAGWGWGWRGGLEGDVVAMSAEDSSQSAPASGQGASTNGAQVTGTNNQEQAADEADVVKTDGEWTYVLSHGVLHILQSRTVGALREHATLSFGNVWGGDLLLERRDPADLTDDRLLVVLPGQTPGEDQPLAQQALASGMSDSMGYGYGYFGSMTRVVVLSLADRAKPTIEHEAWVEGQPSGTRLVDGVAHVVVQTWEQPVGLRTWIGPDERDLDAMNLTYDSYQRLSGDERRAVREALALRIDEENVRMLDGIHLEDQLPVVLRQRFGFLVPDAASENTCRTVLTMPQATGRSFTTVLSVGIADASLPTKTLQVLGGSAIVYADSGALVLASPSQDSWWFWAQPRLEEATDLLWFDVDGLDVSLRASGRVAGTVLDSFSLDVHDSELRVATTVGQWARWWMPDPDPMVTQLVVFEEAAGLLVPRGSVGGLAPGERIWSARFTDDRAYLVTFRNVDPLWVIDLGDTVRVLGELHIPGVSTYLHPIDDDTLLSIGYGPGPQGQDLDWSRVQVSLFDLSDLDDPRRADVLDLTAPGGYSWSGAVDEHKAFTYWEAVDTLAVPMTTTISREVDRGSYTDWVYEQHIGLQLVHVDLEALDLSLWGEVDQDHLASGNSWGPSIERSWFLGYPDTGPVSIYSMSALGVTSHDLYSLARQATVAFPQPEQVYY